VDQFVKVKSGGACGQVSCFCNASKTPAPNSLVPSVNVVVTNDAGDILMIHRTDNGIG
jgi:hypothetical protein